MYAKFNLDRRPEFQFSTVIQKDRVIKRALTQKALPSLSDCVKTQVYFERNLPKGWKVPKLVEQSNSEAIFEKLTGPTLEKRMLELSQSGDRNQFDKLVDQYKQKLSELLALKAPDHLSTPSFVQEGNNLVPFDVVPSNIICQDGNFYIVDLEWFFKGTIEPEHVLARGLLFTLFEKYAELIHLDRSPLSSFDHAKLHNYREVERSFQEFATVNKYGKYYRELHSEQHRRNFLPKLMSHRLKLEKEIEIATNFRSSLWFRTAQKIRSAIRRV